MKVNSVNDLLVQAANALSKRDTETLEALVTVVHSWCQTEAERSAQLAMLDSMLEAAYELGCYEND